MQKKFLKWLFLVVFLAFFLTLSTSYFIQTHQSKIVGTDLIKLKIVDVEHQLDITENNLRTIRQMTDKTAIIKAKFLAWQLFESPNLINDSKLLEKMKNLLDVDEIHISNSKGILIASIPKKYEGMDMRSTEQTKAFIGALSNKNFEFVQEPMLRGAKDGIFQYVAVARIGIPGIVQIGFKPQRLVQAQKLADIKNISDGFRIGKDGSIIVLKDDNLISCGINHKNFTAEEINLLINNSKNIDKPFIIKLNNKKYMAIAEKWKNYIIIGTLPENEMYVNRNSVVNVLLFVNIILFSIIFILISLLLQKVVISGIWKVNKSLNKITEGDLEERVNVKNVQEFEMLSDGINTTVDALKNAIEAETKRMDEELELAKSIQHSSLPNIFPPYPNHNEFEIFASMDTAKEVGGDFYDFFFTDPNHLTFLVADVSGKGIPAALFMMTSKTLIKNLAKTNIAPSDLITKVNKQICKRNEQDFFVTSFLCSIELTTGKTICVNAGHNPPLIRHNDGTVEYFKCQPNLVLGLKNDMQYSHCEIQLNKGDTIFLYTDGVTEASNKNEEFYGDSRLKEKLKTVMQKDFTLKETLTHIKSDVFDFAQGQPQADDITMLAFKYKGF